MNSGAASPSNISPQTRVSVTDLACLWLSSTGGDLGFDLPEPFINDATVIFRAIAHDLMPSQAITKEELLQRLNDWPSVGGNPQYFQVSLALQRVKDIDATLLIRLLCEMLAFQNALVAAILDKDDGLEMKTSGLLQLGSVARWAEKLNLDKRFLAEIRTATKMTVQEAGQTTYQSDDLRLAILASQVFYSDYQPNEQRDRAKGSTIQAWLKGEPVRGYPPNPSPLQPIHGRPVDTRAQRIDQLIRPPQLSNGGNRPS